MNIAKTGILLLGLTLLLVWVGQVLGGTQGAAIALVFALVMNVGSYWFSDKIVLAMYKAQPIERHDSPELFGIVEELTRKADMPMPGLYLVDSPNPNAFATGRGPHHAVVAVTTGILRLLNHDELRGVLAHELGHVRNRDVLTMSIAATIAGAIAMVAMWARWAMLFGAGRSHRNNNGALGVVAVIAVAILAPLAATVIQLAISRTREYGADASGARLVGTPHGLISALRKLEAGSRHMPMHDANPATAHLCIVNPLRGGLLSGLFRTHPAMDRRVERLQQLA